MVWPANDEYWGAAEVVHDPKQTAAMLEKGPRPVIDWEKQNIYEFGDRARNVSADVGERALPSLIAAGPNRSQKRVKRHHPYPTKKDLPPRVEPPVESTGESESQGPVEVKVSKLNDDTVIDVGHQTYLVIQDPEEIWARSAPSHLTVPYKTSSAKMDAGTIASYVANVNNHILQNTKYPSALEDLHRAEEEKWTAQMNSERKHSISMAHNAQLA
ncbi:hypothetical protein COL922a_012481 [Colletotrichum nupharicola]|nr:hypothetical protein COL922a_012481 [Colletotrichum nupharicola]